MRQGQENKEIKEVGKTSTILLDSCRKLFRVVRSSLTNPRIQRAVIHPTRNQPLVKLPKTKASTRTIPLADKLIEHLSPFDSEGFILGGEKPLTYQQKKRSFVKSESGWDLKRIRLTISDTPVRQSGKNTA